MQALKTNSDFFDLISQQYKDHQWFQVLLIVEHNSFTIINIGFICNAIDLSTHIETSLKNSPPNCARAIAIMSTNSMKNNIALIHTPIIIPQCYPIATLLQYNHLCNH